MAKPRAESFSGNESQAERSSTHSRSNTATHDCSSVNTTQRGGPLESHSVAQAQKHNSEPQSLRRDKIPPGDRQSISSTTPNAVKTCRVPLRLASQRENSQSQMQKACHNSTSLTRVDRDCVDDGGARQVFEECPDDPPVTPASLSELDASRIFNNPKLRQDVNFEKELHFRPNTDGTRGKQKSKATQRYYQAVEYELRMIERLLGQRTATTDVSRDPELRQELHRISRRLPKIFASVRDILMSLVPDKEQGHITEHLEPSFLMQQIHNGVCDLKQLSTWLAKIIQTHCAPMRDAKVNRMKKTVHEAVDEQNTKKLADGIKQLVDITEAMKLDVANHQIRHVRLLLIKNTVDFQQRYNAHRIAMGKLDSKRSLAWLKAQMDLVHNTIAPLSEMEGVCSALLWDLISPQGDNPFTPTFYLDFDRLRALSSELHNHISREVCHGVLAQLLPSSSLHAAWAQLQTYLSAITEPQEWAQKHVENIAAQIAKIVVAAPASKHHDQAAIIEKVVPQLHNDLRKDSVMFGRHKAVLFHRVLPKLQVSVHNHVKLTALELQDALVPQTTKHSGARSNGFGAMLMPAQPTMPTDQDTSLVRRLTHIIVLHWQVWADLYLDGEEYEHDMLAFADRTHSASPAISDDSGESAQYASGVSIARSETPCSEPQENYDLPCLETEGGNTDAKEDYTSPSADRKHVP